MIWMASLAPALAEVEAGVVAKADQKCDGGQGHFGNIGSSSLWFHLYFLSVCLILTKNVLIA